MFLLKKLEIREKDFGEAGIEDIHLILAQCSHYWKAPKYLFTVLGALSKSKIDGNSETNSLISRSL